MSTVIEIKKNDTKTGNPFQSLKCFLSFYFLDSQVIRLQGFCRKLLFMRECLELRVYFSVYQTCDYHYTLPVIKYL